MDASLERLVGRLGTSNRLSVSDPRDVPTYGIREAASYMRLPPTTLRAWVTGSARVIPLAGTRPPLLSVAGTGIPTAIIADRLRAGDTLEHLARDSHLRLDQVGAALRWELGAHAH